MPSAARLLVLLSIGSAPFLVAGCASAPPAPREISGPFVIERDLAGATVARGSFSAINGAKRSFTAYLQGDLVGDTFTLKEDFAYDDGEKDRKTWVLRRTGEGTYVGSREDVIGEAKGWQDGPVFRLQYDILLPGKEGDPGMKVRFRDVMANTTEGVVVNNARVAKWGFNVGRVDLEIRKAGDGALSK